MVAVSTVVDLRDQGDPNTFRTPTALYHDLNVETWGGGQRVTNPLLSCSWSQSSAERRDLWTQTCHNYTQIVKPLKNKKIFTITKSIPKTTRYDSQIVSSTVHIHPDLITATQAIVPRILAFLGIAFVTRQTNILLN